VARATIIAPGDIHLVIPFSAGDKRATIPFSSAYLQDSAGKQLASAKPFFMPSAGMNFCTASSFPFPSKHRRAPGNCWFPSFRGE